MKSFNHNPLPEIGHENLQNKSYIYDPEDINLSRRDIINMIHSFTEQFVNLEDKIDKIKSSINETITLIGLSSLVYLLYPLLSNLIHRI